MNSLVKIIFISTILGLLAGCSSSTPVKTVGSYEGIEPTVSDKATVYIYRESSFVGGANQYDVMIDGDLVGSLPNGSFFSVLTNEGEKKIEPKTLTESGFGKGVTIKAERNQVSCLKLTLNFCYACKSADLEEVDINSCKQGMRSLDRVSLD